MNDNPNWDACPQGIENSVKIQNLEGWQIKQNGALVHMAEKMDRLDEKMDQKMGDLQADTQKRFNKLFMWLTGLMGTALLSLLLLILQLMAIAGD